VCDLEDIGVSSNFKTIRSVTTLARMLSTLDLNCEENGSGIVTGRCPDEVVTIKSHKFTM